MAKKKPRIYLRDKIYIPIDCVDPDLVAKAYTKYEWDNYVCGGCELRSDRPCSDCLSCEQGGLKQVWRYAGQKFVRDQEFHTIPLGDIDNVERKLRIDFDKFELIDRTNRKKFRHRVRFTGELRDYQETPVATLVRDKMGILKSKPRTGKCGRHLEPVDTSAGQLSLGRMWELYGKDGQESVPIPDILYTRTAYGIENISWIHRKRSKCLEMTTHIGHTLGATPEHPVFVVTPDLQVVERRMDELRVGDWVVSVPNSALNRRLPVKLEAVPQPLGANTNKIVQPEYMTEDLAYCMGCLVANGTLTTAKQNGRVLFTSNDDTVSEHYSSKMESLFGLTCVRKRRTAKAAYDVIINSVQLAHWLEVNGLCMELSAQKCIPDTVLRSGKEIHLAFLSGYLSCDSSIYKNFIEQITASPVLHKQLATMFMSLGCVATARTTMKAAATGSGIKRKYYRLTLTANNMRNLLDQVKIHKERPVNEGRNDWSRVYGDADNIPYVVNHINSLPLHKKHYYEGKHSLNKHGSLSRNTLLRVKRELLPQYLQEFLSYADTVYFQQVKQIKKLPMQYVYDLTVEGSHTFIASGFMVHNTVMGVAALCEMGHRAIIMADQKDFLDGFYETIQAMTNLPELEEKLGKKLFGFPTKECHWDDFEIVLVTYQQLIKDSAAARKKMMRLRHEFGALLIDEIHKSATPTFSAVLGKMTTRIRLALSATPDEKKNGRQHLYFHMIGPVIATTKAEAMSPVIHIHETPSTVKTRSQFNGLGGWTRFTQFLSKHEDRNRMIVDQIMRDLKDGHNICVPVMYKDHAYKLAKEVNFRYGGTIAATFLGGTKEAKLRKATIDAARENRIRVIFGIRSLMQLGINIPTWSCLHWILPMNNEPNWEQESYRILTPMPDKQQPIIRMYCDTNMVQSMGCVRATLTSSLKFGHTLSPQAEQWVQKKIGSIKSLAKVSVKQEKKQNLLMGFR